MEKKTLVQGVQTDTLQEKKLTAHWDGMNAYAHSLVGSLAVSHFLIANLRSRVTGGNFSDILETLTVLENNLESTHEMFINFRSYNDIIQLQYEECNIADLIIGCFQTASDNNVKFKIEYISNDSKLKSIEVDNLKIISQEDNKPSFIVNIDKYKIKACIDELISNSIQWFDKELRTVRVIINIVKSYSISELKREGKFLSISYIDNGIGVLSHQKELIFKPFFSKSENGSGLGLSMVKKIIEAHGGEIFETGKELQGAQFEFYIPI